MLEAKKEALGTGFRMHGNSEPDSSGQQSVVVPLQQPLLFKKLTRGFSGSDTCEQLPAMEAPSQDGVGRQDGGRSSTFRTVLRQQYFVLKTDGDLTELPPQPEGKRVAEALGAVPP